MTKSDKDNNTSVEPEEIRDEEDQQGDPTVLSVLQSMDRSLRTIAGKFKQQKDGK